MTTTNFSNNLILLSFYTDVHISEIHSLHSRQRALRAISYTSALEEQREPRVT